MRYSKSGILKPEVAAYCTIACTPSDTMTKVDAMLSHATRENHENREQDHRGQERKATRKCGVAIQNTHALARTKGYQFLADTAWRRVRPQNATARPNRCRHALQAPFEGKRLEFRRCMRTPGSPFGSRTETEHKNDNFPPEMRRNSDECAQTALPNTQVANPCYATHTCSERPEITIVLVDISVVGKNLPASYRGFLTPRSTVWCNRLSLCTGHTNQTH